MQNQRGAALIMALVFLVILTILGVTAMSGASLEEKMAGNLKEQTVAFEAAETAVAAGEAALAALNEPPRPLPAGWFDVTSGTPVWKTHNWKTDPSVSYSGLNYVNTQPKFIVEETARVLNGSLRLTTDYSATTRAGKVYYRITGRGTGGTDAAQSVVQSVYAKQFN